jgi:DNA-directed RNA polymerase specialized sigma24 family protein
LGAGAQRGFKQQTPLDVPLFECARPAGLGAVPSAAGSASKCVILPPDPVAWPSLWARCWSRIRGWRAPPHWSPADWQDEARAQGALARCEALREFDSRRLVPIEAFLYRRVVEAVWARYRQEWSFGRRTRLVHHWGDAVWLDDSESGSHLLDRLAFALERLNESDRRLLHRFYWEGCSLQEMSVFMELSRDALKKRRTRALQKLRELLESQDLRRRDKST